MPETIVELKPRPRDRVWIRLSGGRFFTIPESEAGALLAGVELSDAEVERLSRIDQYLRGKDKALRLLAIRARSRREIETALAEMDVIPGVRAGILEELREAGLVDDERFARDYTGSRAEIKHLGPHRIKFELGKLGVSRSIVDRALEETFPAGRQEELARAVARRKLGSRTPDEKSVRRLIDLLRRRGFDYGVINGVAYELLKQRGVDAPELADDE